MAVSASSERCAVHYIFNLILFYFLCVKYMNWASQHTLRVFVLETTLYLYHIASNKYFISGADLGTAFGSDKTQESCEKKKSNTTKSGPDDYPACRFNLGSVIAEYCIDKRQKTF